MLDKITTNPDPAVNKEDVWTLRVEKKKKEII